MRVTFLDSDGVTTRILHDGENRSPLILVHGLGTSAERWCRTIGPLSDSFSVYAPDLLNSGFSSNIAFKETPPQLAHCRQLRGMCEALKISNAVFVGSSYGGLVVTLLALESPELVRKLVVVGSGSALHPPDEQQSSLRAARENGLRALHAGGIHALRQRMANIVFDPASVSEESLPVLLTANALPGRAKAINDLYDSLIGSSAAASAQVFHRLEQIQQPTLIITGRNDPRANWARAEEAARRISHCRLIIYDECGHAPMQEHPHRFNVDLRTFLAEDC